MTIAGGQGNDTLTLKLTGSVRRSAGRDRNGATAANFTDANGMVTTTYNYVFNANNNTNQDGVQHARPQGPGVGERQDRGVGDARRSERLGCRQEHRPQPDHSSLEYEENIPARTDVASGSAKAVVAATIRGHFQNAGKGSQVVDRSQC